MANLTKRKLYTAIYNVEKETELETLRHVMIVMAKIEGETTKEVGNNAVLCCATNYCKLAKFLKQKTEEIIKELKEGEEK